MKRTPIRPVSRKKRTRDASYPAARKAVHDRADGRCEARVCWACTGRCEQVHHRAGRGGDDPHRLDNLVGLCRPCHEWIESHRAWAYDNGWLVRRNGANV